MRALFLLLAGAQEVPDPGVTAPGSPSNLVATALGPTRIGLTWNAPTTGDPVDFYTIRRSTEGPSSGMTLIDSTGSPSYEDTGLTPETQYWYRVGAVNAGGSSSAILDPVDDATTDEAPITDPPLPPSGVSATLVSSSQLDIDWTDNSEGSNPATGFNIYLNGALFDSVGAVETYRASGLAEGTEHGPWEVAATNDNGESDLVGDAFAFTQLAAPTGGSAIQIGGDGGSGFVRFTWSANSGNATGQTFRRNGSEFASLGASVEQYDVPNADADGTFEVGAVASGIPASDLAALGSGPPWPS